MSRSGIAATIVCAVATVLIGRDRGYAGPTAFAAFWCSAALVVGAAWQIARRSADALSFAEAAVRTAVVAFAVVVSCTGLLGAVGELTLPMLLAMETGVFAAAVWFGRRGPATVPAPATAPVPAAVVAIGAATMMFAIAFAVWHAPLTLYDSLSYHLHFAARWVQDRTIAIIPTPFSDEAQAYAPGNGELVLAWLMLPFHGDLLARMGQLPFALGGALLLYAIARRLGCAAAHAVYPALFFLLSRPIAEQMIGANVDLICAASFLAAIYFAIVAADRGDRRDWALFGVAAGLYCGTKYLALVYTPVLLLVAWARGPRMRSLWALPGLAAFGLPWYARNWIVAGSPIYPASLTIGGATIARGAFTRAAMLNTIFHTTDIRLFPAMAAHAVGPALFVVWLPCAIAGWIAMARRGWWPHGVVALVPLVMTPLYWFGFPVNIDSRFLMPAVAPALLPLAFLFPRSRLANVCAHVLFTAAAVWLVVGVRRSIPATLPWFMGGWLALDGILWPQFFGAFAATAVAVAAIWLLVRRSSTAVPVLVSTLACGAVVLALGASRWCGDAGCNYLDTTSPFIRPAYFDAWRWIDGNVQHATIAYTGINLPYPLTGEQLANRVVYVNIDGRARWRFHDYDRAYRSGRFVPSAPPLARSSGELMPVADRSGPRDDAVRPRYERMDGNRDAWIFNLETMRVQYLFVAMLSAYEIDYVWHNERGFPIEDDWAASEPARFHLVFHNPLVHIYTVDTDMRARG